MNAAIQISRPLWSHLGVELQLPPTQDPLRLQDAELLRAALQQHSVVLLRNFPQPVAHQLQVTAALGRVVGVQRSGYGRRVAPELRIESDKRINPYNAEWHSDTSWATYPARYTLLYAQRVDGHCAGTELVDTTRAYQTLDSKRQQEIAHWQAFHHVEQSRRRRFNDQRERTGPKGWTALADAIRKRRRAQRQERLAGVRPATTVLRQLPPPGALHAVVRLDPLTAKRYLSLGEHAWKLQGQSTSDSLRAIAGLTNQITAESVTHQWQQDDLLIFDNRLLLHRRSQEHGESRPDSARELRRSLAWLPESVLPQ